MAEFQPSDSSDEEPLNEPVKKSKTEKRNAKVTERNKDILNATDTVRPVPKHAINSNDVNNASVTNQNKPDNKDAGRIDIPLCKISMPHIYSHYIKNVSMQGFGFERKILNPQTTKVVQPLQQATACHQIGRPSSQCFIQHSNTQELSKMLQTFAAVNQNDAENLQNADGVVYDDAATCNSNDDMLFLRSFQQPASSQNSKIQKVFKLRQRKRRISSPGLLLKEKSTKKIALSEFLNFNDNMSAATSLVTSTMLPPVRPTSEPPKYFIDCNWINNKGTFQEMCTDRFNVIITESKCEAAAPPSRQTITWIDENENVDPGNGKTVDISGLSTLLPLSVENSTKNSSLQNQEHVAVQRNDQSITNVEEPLIDGNGNVTITNVEVVDINSLPACLSLSVENSTIDLNFQSILQNQEHVAVQRNDQPPINVEEPLMQDTVRSYLLDYSSEAPLDLSLNKTMWNATNCCSMQLRKSADDCAPLDLCVRSSANMVPQINNNNNLNKEQHSLSVNEDVSFTNMLDSPFLGFDEHEFNIHSTITQTSSHASIKEEMQISLKSSTNDDSMRISVSNVNCAIEGKAENGMLFSDNQFGINYNENGENSNPSENKTITQENSINAIDTNNEIMESIQAIMSNEISGTDVFFVQNPKVNDKNECFTQKLNHNYIKQISEINDNNIRSNGMNTGLRPPNADCLDSDTDDLNKGSLGTLPIISTISDELRDETFVSRCENDAETRECFTAVADHNSENENIRNHGDDGNELIKDQVNSEKEMFADKSTPFPEKVDDVLQASIDFRFLH
ncbi:uncharacterized protein ACN427_012027 [Glossina fuscipes fuscipes]